MNRIDRFIIDCSSFEEFRKRTSTLPTKKDKGDVFERLTQVYLQTAPEYRTLDKVWLLNRGEVPPSDLAKIGLPREDLGIDLIARHRSGKYWTIQAKFRSDEEGPLGWGDLSTFTALSAAPRRNIALTVVAHPIARPVGRRELMHNFVEIGLDAFRQADWSLIRWTILKNAPTRPNPSTPTGRFAWQRKVIDKAVEHFRHNARGRVQLPCGTGKSLLGYFIADALKANTIVVAVPSLALLKQSVGDVWMREEVARERMPDSLCVASDDTVGKVDDVADERADIGLPTTTSADEIADWLRKPGDRKIVFTTYQSSAELTTAASLAGFAFDLIILDEAHRTAGARRRDFVSLLDAEKITARHRLFMTATEKRFRKGDVETMLSMDDSKQDYGPRFYTMSFKEAIERDIITDYKIVTYFVTEQVVKDLIRENRLLNLGGDQIAAVDASDVASAVITKRVMKKYGVNHPLVFARNISASKAFRDQQNMLNDLKIGPRADNFHVDSTMSAEQRKGGLAEFIEKPRSVMSNARCLTEGVNVPGIDAVIFAAPKHSVIDIVQASGRAMRKAPGKEYGHIVIPIDVPDGMTYKEFAESTQFKKIVQVVSALSTVDTRIVEELRARFCGPTGGKNRERIIKIGGEVPIGFKMNVEQIDDAIETKSWETVARLNPRPFEEARAYARSLGLNKAKEWYAHCTTGPKPADIPFAADRIYRHKGWVSWGDWLGTGRLSNKGRIYRPFDEARAYARSLGLESMREWRARTDQLPPDIPKDPFRVYRREWVSSADFLGSEYRKGGYRPFLKARKFARSLGLNSFAEWRKWAKSDARPPDIPVAPNTVYREQWVSFDDWVGKKPPPPPRSFKEAREFARSLGLKSQQQWNKWRSSGKRPDDIPTNPHRTYARLWKGWSDFLGTDKPAGRTGPQPKLSEHQQREALARLATGEETLTEIARKYNVSRETIRRFRSLKSLQAARTGGECRKLGDAGVAAAGGRNERVLSSAGLSKPGKRRRRTANRSGGMDS